MNAPSGQPPRVLLFVYGTLKRGGLNHAWLAGQVYVGAAETTAGYTLYLLDGYPGMIADASDQNGVTGELWSVDRAVIPALDDFEGVRDGLYRREPVALKGSAHAASADAYIYARSTAGRKHLGSTWPV